MKKLLKNVFALTFLLLFIWACSDNSDIAPFEPNEVTQEKVELKDYKYDTDITPPDTSSVVR